MLPSGMEAAWAVPHSFGAVSAGVGSRDETQVTHGQLAHAACSDAPRRTAPGPVTCRVALPAALCRRRHWRLGKAQFRALRSRFVVRTQRRYPLLSEESAGACRGRQRLSRPYEIRFERRCILSSLAQTAKTMHHEHVSATGVSTINDQPWAVTARRYGLPRGLWGAQLRDNPECRISCGRLRLRAVGAWARMRRCLQWQLFGRTGCVSPCYRSLPAQRQTVAAAEARGKRTRNS